jgi:hypothetical protein
MGHFEKKQDEQAASIEGGSGRGEDHAVLIHFRLSDDSYGSPEEREAVMELERELEVAIAASNAGEFDGNEYGGGEAVLYMYGPDKDRLWQAVEQLVRRFPLRPAYALLRPGGPDTAAEQVPL